MFVPKLKKNIVNSYVTSQYSIMEMNLTTLNHFIDLCHISGVTLHVWYYYLCSPRFDLPTHDPVAQAKKASIVCHFCGETGHKAANCSKIKNDEQGSKVSHLGY